ncbi:MAG TPA: SDR family NAD(P)-dependent oxidoreductase, partial [Blastocatellia bacterium]|nr:SDR family NAD(P)-dependent oxidoreductase [Blastocatellia bacterium]
MESERQVVFISGGSRGLGRALVNDLLEQGHVVATFSRKTTDFIRECQSKDSDQESFIWQEIDAADADSVK